LIAGTPVALKPLAARLTFDGAGNPGLLRGRIPAIEPQLLPEVVPRLDHELQRGDVEVVELDVIRN